MIRAFDVTDILLMRNLQRRSATLAIEHTLTHPRRPLWIALTSPWPWAGLGIATCILNESDTEGQASDSATDEASGTARSGCAPPGAGVARGRHERVDSEATWHRYWVTALHRQPGHRLQRIFASIADGGPEEACLKDTVFSLFTRAR